jgi:hypothetical protein
MRRILIALTGVAASGLVAVAASLQTPNAPAPQVPTAAAPLLATPVAAMTSPAPAGSAQPYLTAIRNGRVLMSWLTPVTAPGAPAGQRSHKFQYSELAGDKWSAPKTIAEGPRMFANWADFPQLFVTSSGVLAAHWLERRGQGRTSYDVKLRTSRTAGRTWSNEVIPHRDGTETEHGFVSFFETPVRTSGLGAGTSSGFGLVWLDGREMAGHPGGHGAGGGQMTLRSAMVSADGVVGAETVVDARVCDCCQTSAATTDTGVVVAYRDRSDKEIRDIYVTRLENGKWSPGTPVHADNWEINGCPVNGPAIAAKGQSVAVAWFSAKDDKPKTQLAFSSDGGRTFGPPVRIDSGTTLGRVGLTMLADGRALVSWIDNQGASAKFMLRDVKPDGTMGAPVTVGAIGGDRPSGFPQIAVSGRKVVLAWTTVVKGVPTGISVATATLAR